MVKDTQILIRLSSDQKQDWQNHVEENGKYRDLTDLIEQCVEDRITEDDDEFSLEDDLEMLYYAIDEVKEQNNNLKQLSEKIERRQATNQSLEEKMEEVLNKIDRELGEFLIWILTRLEMNMLRGKKEITTSLGQVHANVLRQYL